MRVDGDPAGVEPIHAMRSFRSPHPAARLFIGWIAGAPRPRGGRPPARISGAARLSRPWRRPPMPVCGIFGRMPGLLSSLNTSPLRELTTLDGGTAPSGIFKRAVSGRRNVGRAGIDGDARADMAMHGGPAKAVYAYPSEHYPFWTTLRAQFGAGAWGDGLPFGTLGENLTLAGLLEIDVWVGDVLRFPDCALGVSGPRLPCPKLDVALGFGHASRAMVARAWCGFYLAVHVPGTISAGETFEVVPGPRAIGITELFRARSAG